MFRISTFMHKRRINKLRKSGMLELGENVTTSFGCLLLTSDDSMSKIGYAKMGKIRIHDDSYIGPGAIVHPGVTIGANSIVLPGAVVIEDVPSEMVVAGNPAKSISATDKFLDEHKAQSVIVFDPYKGAILADDGSMIQSSADIQGYAPA